MQQRSILKATAGEYCRLGVTYRVHELGLLQLRRELRLHVDEEVALLLDVLLALLDHLLDPRLEFAGLQGVEHLHGSGQALERW